MNYILCCTRAYDMVLVEDEEVVSVKGKHGQGKK